MADKNDNLTPFIKGTISSEVAAKNGAKGGTASGITKRERKKIRETIEEFLSMPSKKGGATNQDEVVLALMKKAQGGDVMAFNSLRDTVGEKPTDKVEASTTNINIDVEPVTTEEAAKVYAGIVKKG